MRLLFTLLITVLSLSLQAKSFDCYLYLGSSTTIELKQISFAQDDPEEESEEYELILESGLVASVLYLPYQDGLSLSIKKGEVLATSSFDQESDEFANLDLSFGSRRYSLSCIKR